MTESCCPSCGSEDLLRIKRGFFVKLFLPWFSFRRFSCERCFRTHYQWPNGMYAPGFIYLIVAPRRKFAIQTPPLSNTFIPYHLNQGDGVGPSDYDLSLVKKMEAENALLKERLTELILYNKLVNTGNIDEG